MQRRLLTNADPPDGHTPPNPDAQPQHHVVKGESHLPAPRHSSGRATGS